MSIFVHPKGSFVNLILIRNIVISVLSWILLQHDIHSSSLLVHILNGLRILCESRWMIKTAWYLYNYLCDFLLVRHKTKFSDLRSTVVLGLDRCCIWLPFTLSWSVSAWKISSISNTLFEFHMYAGKIRKRHSDIRACRSHSYSWCASISHFTNLSSVSWVPSN